MIDSLPNPSRAIQWEGRSRTRACRYRIAGRRLSASNNGSHSLEYQRLRQYRDGEESMSSYCSGQEIWCRWGWERQSRRGHPTRNRVRPEPSIHHGPKSPGVVEGNTAARCNCVRIRA
jgi:hypothetical protein